MTREISKEHWGQSFDKYFKNGALCGYCGDTRKNQGNNCGDCIIDNNICGTSKSYYQKMMRAKSETNRLKYKNLIREYILSEGRRLHYITDEQEKVASEVMNEVL